MTDHLGGGGGGGDIDLFHVTLIFFAMHLILEIRILLCLA